MDVKNHKILELKLKNVLLIFGIMISMALSITSALLLGQFIDLLTKQQTFNQEIALFLLAMFALMLLTALANLFFTQYFPLKLQLKKSMKYSQDIMSGVLKLSQKNYQKQEKGYYINLVTSSAFTYGTIYEQMNIDLIGNAIAVLILLIISALISPYLAGIYFVYIPIYAFLIHKPNKMIANYQKDGLPTQDAYLSETKKIVEDKTAINIARANGYYKRRYQNKSNKYLDFVIKFRWFSILSGNIPSVLSSFLQLLTIALATVLYFQGAVSIGTILIMFQFSQILQAPLNRCFEIWIHRSINDVHLQRVEQFLSLQNEASGFDKLYKTENQLVKIADGVFYTNAEKSKKLFMVNNLEINKNSLIIVKGANGTGKSMFVNYLTGFSDVDSYDGDIRLDTSLKSVAYLSYPILIVEGDIQQNMFGQEINQEVYNMLDITFADKIISDSVVNLSFGEKQKLNLLRVLSSEASVMILDEPFSNLIAHSDELDEYADDIFQIKLERMIRTK